MHIQLDVLNKTSGFSYSCKIRSDTYMIRKNMWPVVFIWPFCPPPLNKALITYKVIHALLPGELCFYAYLRQEAWCARRCFDMDCQNKVLSYRRLKRCFSVPPALHVRHHHSPSEPHSVHTAPLIFTILGVHLHKIHGKYLDCACKMVRGLNVYTWSTQLLPSCL